MNKTIPLCLCLIITVFFSGCSNKISSPSQRKQKTKMSTNLPTQTKMEKKVAEIIQPLMVKESDFIDHDGNIMRLWGVNLVVLFPEHDVAEKTAANLASLGINCVRHHHMLRISKDWNPDMVSGCLVDYKNDSLTFDPQALDRFDYLNSCLRKKGIYMMIAIGNSRHYLPEDVKILDQGDKDNKSWSEAVKELNSWHWQKSHDVKKMLPMVDERAARINEEFAKKLLNHVNPYTKTKYAADPQLLTIEVINEFSLDYAVICNNKFPEYWQKILNDKWQKFTKEKGVKECDLFQTKTTSQRKCRGEFFRKLQEDYLNRITKVIRDTGFKGPISFSNLWRGEAAAKFHWDTAGYIEDHLYCEPRVVESKEDFLIATSKSRLAGKPYILGEVNYCEWGDKTEEQRRERAMLPLALAAYGSFNNWSGIIWFAWNHGGRVVGKDGWSNKPDRQAHLGDMISDEMMLDHFRTCSAIFRRGLVKKSVVPKNLYVYGDYIPASYYALIQGITEYQPGWQNIHALQKVFSKPPEGDKTWELLHTVTPDILISDTKEIIKDTNKKHLTVKTPFAEAFAGNLNTPDKITLDHLQFSETDCFATIIMITNDGKSLKDTEEILISRTTLDKKWQDTDKGTITIKGLKTGGKKWHAKITRPHRNAGNTIPLEQQNDGAVIIPVKDWFECKIELK